MNRRAFLALSGAGAAGALLGPWCRRAGLAAGFGEVPEDARDAILPEHARADGVLEVFLTGGLSAWETLYLVEAYGRPDDPLYPNEQIHAFLGAGADSVDSARIACGIPSGAPLGQPFAVDALGASVALGPFAHLLRQRPDVTDRMRIVVQAHAVEPHEAAIPLALTGQPLGQPTAAGLGTHIQRYFADRGASDRVAPYSYAFFSGPGTDAVGAVGQHPTNARPLLVTIQNAGQFAQLVERQSVGTAQERAAYDRLVGLYADDYRDRLRWRGEVVRSAAFAELESAAHAIGRSDGLAGYVPAALFDDVPGALCGESYARNLPRMALDAARHVLTHPSEPARYAIASDSASDASYDTHAGNSYGQARAFHNMLEGLLAGINHPNEHDPGKIDLDRTMIVLNTEFGRSPRPQLDSATGRNHHPYGYVTAFIGGPIGAEQRGVFGAIGPDAVATEFVTPAENRVAVLLALGIWPFGPEGFGAADVPGAADEVEAARLATHRVLGHLL